MFLFSIILMTCCVVTYIVGIHLHIVCRDMKDGEALDLLIDGKIDISQSLQNCRQNQALYTALNAATLFNFNVTKELNVTEVCPEITSSRPLLILSISFEICIKDIVVDKYKHRNIKTQGITTGETSFIKLMVSIDFVNHLKSRRVEFFQCIFKKILVR